MPRDEMLRCSLNDATATWGETTLAYDNVTVGNWGNVSAGMTLLAYTSAGVYRGKVRVRAITAAEITVAANNDIEWTDDDILVVVNVYEPWSVPTAMADVGGTITYYKDTDITWTDNDTTFPPKSNDQGAWAGFLGAAGHVDIEFDAGDSFANAPGATIASYSRDIADGVVVAGAAAAQTCTLRFSSAGFRWVTTTVTDSNGKTGVHRMPIWTFGGNYQPFDDFSIRRRTKAVRDGELTIEAFGSSITPDDIPDGTRVVLFAVTKIGGVEVTTAMGCPFDGRGHIKFDGYILKDETRWDPETGICTFSVGTLGKIADDMPGYATFIKDVDAADAEDWHTGVDLTVRSTIFFLLRWQTNLTELAYMEIEPTRLIAGRKFPKAPPFKQIENAFLQNKGLFAHLGVSRWGSVHIRYDPQELDDADRNARATVIDLTDEDWLEEAQIEKNHRPKMSSIFGGGIAYDGDDGTPYRGRSPGQVGRESGRDGRADNLIIDDQDELNTILGRALAAQSAPYEATPVNLFYDVFEPVLQEYVTLTIVSSENPREYEFDTSTRWIVRRVDVDDVPAGTPSVRITIEFLATGLEGVTVEIPDPPTYPLPPAPSPIWTPTPPLTLYTYALLGTVGATSGSPAAQGVGAGVCMCLDVDAATPEWEEVNDGFPVGIPKPVIESLDVSDSEYRWHQKAACIARTDSTPGVPYQSELWTIDNWSGGEDSWTKRLTKAEAATAIEAVNGSASFNFAGGDWLEMNQVLVVESGGSDVILCAVRYENNVETECDGTDQNRFVRVLRSTDWGTSWTAGDRIPVKVSAGGTDGCSAALHNLTGLGDDPDDSAAGCGALLYDGGTLYATALAPAGGSMRGNLVTSSDLGDSWTWQAVSDSGLGEADDIGVGSAIDSVGGLYMALWEIADGTFSVAYTVDLGTNLSEIAEVSSAEYDAGEHLAESRTMLCTCPTDHVMFLLADITDEETDIYTAARGSAGAVVETLTSGIFRTVRADPKDEDGLRFVLGRSHQVEEDTASGSALIMLSEDRGVNWASINGSGATSLYSLGARGVTDIRVVTVGE
jgi:hypothetical protein